MSFGLIANVSLANDNFSKVDLPTTVNMELEA
jgi:hypothetical protein